MKEWEEEEGAYVQSWEHKAMIYSRIMASFAPSHPSPFFPRGETGCASLFGGFLPEWDRMVFRDTCRHGKSNSQLFSHLFARCKGCTVN
jgi:hypothetical protein